MAKRRIMKSEIAVGHKLPWDVFDAEGRLLLRRGQTVETGNQIEKLIELGLFADIDTPWKGTEPELPAAQDTRSPLALILEARRRWQYLSAPTGVKEQFPEHLASIRALIAEACGRNPDVALAAILLERKGRYSIRHSVDSATLCQLVGRAAGMAEPELASTVAAALTMNLSILLIQDGLLSQKPPLPPDRLAAIRRHPRDSAALLRSLGVSDETWLAAVLNHHEALDGSGYPEGKKAGAIPFAAQLASLADRYCAAVSARDYRPALLPGAALKRVLLSQGGAVDKTLATHFIKLLGPYPPGTAVRLASEEIAVVVRPGDTAATPQVCALTGPRGALAAPIRRDTGREGHGVREAVDWSRLGPGVNMQAVWGRDAALV